MFLFFKKGLSRFLGGGRFLFQFAEMFLWNITADAGLLLKRCNYLFISISWDSLPPHAAFSLTLSPQEFGTRQRSGQLSRSQKACVQKGA